MTPGKIRGARVFGLFRDDLLRVAFLAGICVVVVAVFGIREQDEFTFRIGIALVIAGGVGAYMMSTTRKVAENLYIRMDTISSDIYAMSGKIDTMSGKMDTMSGKMDTQTEILKDIRDSLANRPPA